MSMENQGRNQDPMNAGSGVIGGPGMSMEAKPAPDNTESKVIVGGMVFNSAEEADQYIVSLKRDKEAAESIVTKYIAPTQQYSQPVQETVVDEESELADLMLQDPVAYTKRMIDIASDRSSRKATSAVRSDSMWDGFYQKNPDLRNHKGYINYLVTTPEIKERTKNLSPEAALEIVNKEARKSLFAASQAPSGGETLSSEPAMVAGSVQTNVTKQSAPQKKALTFADQILERQKKRRA